MEDIQQALNLNLWPLLTVALLGLVCYFVIRLVKRVLFATTGAAPWVVGIRGKWPVLERLFWTCYFLGALGALIKPNPLVGSIIALLILAATWAFIKNYMAGILILVEGGIKVGQSIRFDEYEGKVVALNALNCDVELDDTGKETLKVPYAKIASRIMLKTSPSENVVTQTAILEVDKKRNPIQVEEEMESCLIDMPWLVINDGFSIERLEGHDEQHHRFKVVLHGIDKKQVRRGVEQLKSKINPAG